MKKSSKRALALIIAVAMCVGMFAVSAAAANTNYTQNWNNGKGSSTFTNGSGGNFSATWNLNAGGNCVIGKGWNPGNANMVIGYNVGVFNQTSSSGCTWFGLYGWTTNSLVEFYVIDRWVNYRPAEGTKLGTLTSDGQTYEVWKSQQVNQPSISGTQTYWRIMSVNLVQRALGQNNTITLANHVAGWKRLGFNIGTNWNYVILAVEGYESKGSFSGTVWSTP